MLFEQLNPDKCKSYLITNPKTNCCILIDPKLDYVDFYVNKITENLYKLLMVIDTHSHSDHLSACSFLKEFFGCIYAMHENSTSSSIDLGLRDNDHINLGEILLKIIYTPGHTDDSICVIVEDKIITGDVLFLNDSCGRDDLPTSNSSLHWKSLKKLKKLPEYLIVCPGHNYPSYPSSTIWFQKQVNPVLNFRNIKEYLSYIYSNHNSISNIMKKIISENKKSKKDYSLLELAKKEFIYEGYSYFGDIYQYITSDELKTRLNSGEDLIPLNILKKKELKDGLLNYYK